MEIKVLGPGCKNCVTLDRITHEVIAEMGLIATFEKIEDYAAIASYGVMSTPPWWWMEKFFSPGA